MRFDGIQGYGGGPVPGVDPDTYAQTYAEKNGISLEEAKAELRAKYGDPQQMSMQRGLLKFSGQGANFELNPYGAVSQDPQMLEKFIQDGAIMAGCTPEEFAEMIGIPPKQTNSSTSTASATTSSTTSGTTSSSTATAGTSTTNDYSNFEEIESQAKKIYDNKTTYETTREERKEIRKQTKEYVKQLNSYIKEYVDNHKSDWKSASSRSEKKALKNQVYKDAEQYAISKFKEQYPDVDITTIFYNIKEDTTGGSLFSHPNLKPYN